MTMTRKGRRVLKSVTSSMVLGSMIGVGVGIYFHLTPWFFIVMGLLLMFGVSLYPTHWSERHHRHHHHHRHYDDSIYDEA